MAAGQKSSPQQQQEKNKDRKNIVFVHPDLGIGGAERWVIDAAVGLQGRGHRVAVLTSWRDKGHCFEEARDGTLDVRVRGNTIFPPHFHGRLSILLAILRQLHLVLTVCLTTSELRNLNPDVIFVDQLSICIPAFRILYPKAQVLFYGHYPDRLLAQEGKRMGWILKKFYRLPFDLLEGWSTGCADVVVVNSKYTRSVFRQTFGAMRRRDLKVVYPCVDTEGGEGKAEKEAHEQPLWPDKKVFLSINRFEGKKNLNLAIRAYAGLSTTERSKSRLIIAGGYDPRSPENATTHANLQTLASELNLTHATFQPTSPSTTDLTTDEVDILFLLSVPAALKRQLLASAALLLYTPTNEHFGIVPLEAMLARVPVLATNTGGPLESIYDGRTGFLCAPSNLTAWTDVLRKPLIPSSATSLQKMGQAGRDRVLAEFSQDKMTDELEAVVEALCKGECMRNGHRPDVMPDMLQPLVVIFPLTMVCAVVVAGLMWFLVRMEPREGGTQPGRGRWYE